MSNFYIRHNVGSDAAAGSKAAPWATITSGATAARIAPGDTIYIGKSPDPVRVTGVGGADVDGTWTKNSNTLTFSVASWVEIHACNATTGWVASANITVATNGNRREGTNSIQITPASGFTTGLAAYLPVSALDLAGCTGISFWAGATSGTIAANTWRIDLCSDAVGAVAVYSFTIDRSMVSTGFGLQRFYLDIGSSMTTAINSIAITALSDPGTTAFHIDNIVAVTPKANLYSLFGKDSTAAIGTGTDDGWFSIESFGSDGITAKLAGGLNSDSSPTSRAPFFGTTETVALYSRQMVVVTTAETVQDSGTSSSAIAYQGGYDFVADAVNGETILYFPVTAGVSIPLSFVTFANVSVVGSTASSGAPFTIAGHGNVVTIPIAASSPNTSAVVTTNGNRNSTTIYHAWGCSNATILTNGNSVSFYCYNLSAMSSAGFTINGGHGWKVSVKNGSPGSSINIFQINDTGAFNRLIIENALENYGRIANFASTDKDYSGIDIYQSQGGTTGVPSSAVATAANNATGVLRNINAPSSGTVATTGNYSKITFERYDQTDDNHKMYGHSNTLEWENSTAQTHGTTGFSWKGTPNSGRDINTPAIFEFADETLEGGVATVINLWVYLTNASSIVKFILYGGQIEGIDNDVTVTANTGTLNSWQQLSLASVTPTVTGSIKLAVEAYGSNQPFYFGDPS